MTDEQQIILDGLRDLNLPTPISGWPPAPGWWILSIGLLVVVGCVVAWFFGKRRRHHPRTLAATALQAAFTSWREAEDPAVYLQQSHHILRQLAIDLAGRRQVSRLCGNQWVEWLEQQTEQALPEVARRALVRGAYQRAGMGKESIEQVHVAYLQWVKTARVSSCVLPHAKIRATGSKLIQGSTCESDSTTKAATGGSTNA